MGLCEMSTKHHLREDVLSDLRPSTMEVVALSGSNNGAPFKREVHEWQHIDAKTGALLSGRLQADRYVNGNTNKYGKSLSQNIQTSDGVHSQHKQMNIFQTITSNGGALQVIQAQTVQKSSSRRAISSTTYSSQFSSNFANGAGHGSFSSGHPMNSDLLSINPRALHHEAAPRLKALLSSPTSLMAGTSSAPTDNTSNRKTHLFHQANNDMNQNVVGTEQSRQQQLNEMLYGNNKEIFTQRGRSASIEDLASIDETSFDGDVEPCEWKRVSKIRRSLQFPKSSETRRVYTRPPDLPENSVNVWKIKQDIESIENSRRLSTAMRNNHVDFVALDSILKDSPMDSLNSQHDHEESKSNCITADSLKEIRRRLKKLNNGHDLYKEDLSSIDENINQKSTLEQNCKSLELRKNRERDGSTDEWLNRRKSYGFEKMQQPTETFNGIESSTDSGLGRSSDLASNWSPVDTQRTIITFGDKTKPATTSISLFGHPKSAEVQEKPIPMRRSFEKKDELKRHSIAVDESRYVDEHFRSSNDRKISLVNLNGVAVERPSSNDGFLDENRRHNKKVEFCKTEIHFAADSGRVKIVETDGKPPPTSNFRRRRRTSGSYLDEIGSDLSMAGGERDSESPLMEATQSNVTTTIGSVFSSLCSRDDDTDDGQSEDSSLRGILKNKPVKPKPYHLGENFDSGNSLWGVRLKPVENQHTTWRHSADLDSLTTTTKKSSDDALEAEFKNLVRSIDDTPNQYQSTVTNNGYSTKINLSTLPTHHPAPSVSKDSSALYSTSTSLLSSAHKSSTLTSFTDSRPANGNETLSDKDQRLKGHKISIDLKLPHPSSIDTIMDELKSTSLIIKTMKSTSYFDDAMRHLEQESPLIRTSSLRLNQDALPKSSSTSMVFRKRPDGPQQPVKYSSSLDGDRGILDGKDDFEFLNGFLEENRKFQMSIAQKEKHSPPRELHRPVAAPRLKKIINTNVQLSQQLSQLKHLYDIANDSDDNAKADEEVKSYLSMNDEEKSSELSGSWSRVRVKKIASAFQSASTSSDPGAKWPKVPLTSLYSENATAKPIEAPRTSLIQIGTTNDKISSSGSSIYNNVSSSQDNSVKVNIQNFESRSPALSRNNSLRIKKDDTSGAQRKLSTGTRQLRDHELTYFGVPNSKPTTTTDSKFTKSSFAHLSTSKSSSSIINTSSLITNMNHQLRPSSTIIVNHLKHSPEIDLHKPDLLMQALHHHQQQKSEASTPELSTAEKKSMMETLDSCIDETKNLDPLYENLYQNQKVKYDRKTDLARDEKILNELTRAADEIMNTCKEMYHADSEEKRRKSLLSNTTCLETITEGRQQRAVIESQQQKVMKSKGVQVSRNFEDSLRRYHPTPQRTSSQSSIESLPRNTKLSSLSSAGHTKRTTKSGESTASTTVSSTKSSSSKKRENGTNSDGSKQRIHRVSSRERMHQSNASSSEDLPNSSSETPRRPRRTKVVKHKEENAKEDKKTSRLTRTTESSLRRSARSDHASNSKVSSETRVRSSTVKSSALSTSSPNQPHQPQSSRKSRR